MSGALQQGFPQPDAPIVDPATGRPVPWFWRLLLTFLNRTGGAQGVSTTDISLEALLRPLPVDPPKFDNAALFAGAIIALGNAGTSSPTPAGGSLSDVVTTTEAIGPNMLGQIYPSGVRKADAASGGTKSCNCFVVATYGSGVNATVYMPGQYITGLSLTALTTYWLGNGGALSSTPPASGSGSQQQQVGVADSTGTKLFFNPQTELQTV